MSIALPQDASGEGRAIPGQHDSRREDVLNVAAHLFAKEGYEATTVREIGNAVGMLSGSLYHYFKSKEELLFEILISSHDAMTALLDEHRLREGSPLERLRAFLEAHVMLSSGRLDYAAVFHTEFRNLTGERRDIIVQKRREYAAYLSQLIADARSDGLIRLEAVPEHAVSSFVLASLNTLHQWYKPNGPLTREQLAPLIASLIVNGLASDKVEEVAHGAHTMNRNVQ